jgi:uncharacterized protein YjcR
MYLVVHNRDVHNREFAQAIQERLTDLVATGRVARAELWDRQRLLANAFDRVKQMLAEALRDTRARTLDREGSAQLSLTASTRGRRCRSAR